MMEQVVDWLKALAEPTRLRIVLAVSSVELTVSDLCEVLGQSQPRVSRHLRVLVEAGVLDRNAEGTSAYYRWHSEAPTALLAVVHELADVDAAQLARDHARIDAVIARRSAKAEAYFSTVAPEWDEIRARHIAEDRVEEAVLDEIGVGPVDLLVDIGTGTGRMLELAAPVARRCIGFDFSRDMLAVARSRLADRSLAHCEVRLGDAYDLPLDGGVADVVVVHHVLHFLDDPAAAIDEAARLLAPHGRLVVVDFAEHEHEELRELYTHRRLGFQTADVRRWCRAAGLGAFRERTLAPARDGADSLTVSLWSSRLTAPRSTPLALEAAS